MDIPVFRGEVPFVDTNQMRAVDRSMIEDYHIDLIQMMENAGRNLAHLARRRFFAGDPQGKRAVVLAGAGGNGGGALACARRLHNFGAGVKVYTTKPKTGFAGVPAHQLEILLRMGIEVSLPVELGQAGNPDLIVDGVIGYSLRGSPRGAAAELIRWANAQPAPILALDLPSGVDAASGVVYDPAIRATATMTLALPKVGLQAPGARGNVGELYLADISVPPELYSRPALRLEVGHIFAAGEIVRLW